MAKRIFLSVGLMCLGGCAAFPPYTLFGDHSVSVAPDGPTVASLVANLKCQLYKAANDDHVLPYYRDRPQLDQRHFRNDDNPNYYRSFTLRNYFSEIEVIAEYELSLQVTSTVGASPSANFVTPFTPATNFTLAIGGQLSESASHTIDLFETIDFSRLVASPRNAWFAHPSIKNVTFKREKPPQSSINETTPCGGTELSGDLGMTAQLATAAIIARQQDVAALAGNVGSMTFDGVPAPAKFSSFAFGENDSTIMFTITAGLSGGPNWTLTTTKIAGGGGGGPAGPLNFSRVAKDTLQITFLPVCIRQSFVPRQWEHPTKSPLTYSATKGIQPPLHFPVEYDPPMNYGTPIWANYLPPCASPEGREAILAAPAQAKTNLQFQGLTNTILRRQF